MSRQARLLVAIDDADVPNDALRSWSAQLAARGTPACLYVRPLYLGASQHRVQWLTGRVRGGDEVVLDESTYRIPLQQRRLRRKTDETCGSFGRWLGEARSTLRALHLPARGAAPPTWLDPGAAERLLRDAGFGYVVRPAAVRDLRVGTIHHFTTPFYGLGRHGLRAAGVLMVAHARVAVTHGVDVQIRLSAAELADPVLRDTALRAIDAALAAGARPATYGALVGEAVAAR